MLKRKTLGRAVAVVLALLCLGAASPAPAPESHKQPNQTEAAQAEAPRTEDGPQEPFWERVATDPVAAFTLVLAAFTAVLTGATILLWLEARTSGERRDRAYVSGTPNFIHSFAPGVPPQFRWAVKNHGPTPASHMRMRAGIALAPFPFQPGLSLPPLIDWQPWPWPALPL